MNYTDEQLKQALAKMLPDVISYREVIAHESCKIVCLLQWGAPWNDEKEFMVRDTELLHLCWLVEEKLTDTEQDQDCIKKLMYHASWQQRVEALAEVKGIDIV